jgi:hypothetical protein
LPYFFYWKLAMRIANIRQAKTQLSRSVERAARAEPCVIAIAGKPLGQGERSVANMNSCSANFELTDAMISAAVRQNLVAHARQGIGVWELVLVPLSAVVFLNVIHFRAHWIGWVSGIPLLLLIVQALAFVGSYLWLPRRACMKVRHLPHRMVRIEISGETVSMENATGKLQVKWSEVQDLAILPDYWLICLRSSGSIPVPITSVSEVMAAEFRRRQNGFHGGDS